VQSKYPLVEDVDAYEEADAEPDEDDTLISEEASEFEVEQVAKMTSLVALDEVLYPLDEQENAPDDELDEDMSMVGSEAEIAKDGTVLSESEQRKEISVLRPLTPCSSGLEIPFVPISFSSFNAPLIRAGNTFRSNFIFFV
jgi:hypothetical protein